MDRSVGRRGCGDDRDTWTERSSHARRDRDAAAAVRDEAAAAEARRVLAVARASPSVLLIVCHVDTVIVCVA